MRPGAWNAALDILSRATPEQPWMLPRTSTLKDRTTPGPVNGFAVLRFAPPLRVTEPILRASGVASAPKERRGFVSPKEHGLQPHHEAAFLPAVGGARWPHHDGNRRT